MLETLPKQPVKTRRVRENTQNLLSLKEKKKVLS